MNRSKSFECVISTTDTSPRLSDNMENLEYLDLSLVDNSESSSQFNEAGDFHNFQNENYDRQQQHQQYQCQHQPTLIRPPSQKILPPTLLLTKESNTDSNAQLTETTLSSKSLLEMGFKANEVEGWENIVQPLKQDLYKLIKHMIINHIKPSVQIRIGTVNFNCHMIVLQCYSDFFMECNNEILVQLPEEKITPGAFMMVYEWMLAEAPLVQREGILELFNAANFLRIKELINQCWLCLDDDVRFCEDTAFLLYLEARKHGLESLEQLMLARICKFFLTLVASTEFLSLTAKEVVMLLSSNSIGVNSEIEIFMSAVRWLNHCWQEREPYLLDILKTVRFNLIPPWFLVTLTQQTGCVEIDRILLLPEVSKMISDGITYSTTELYYGENREQFISFLKRYHLIMPIHRQWIFDKECKYHHRFECPHMQYITYKDFLEYLERIQAVGKDYWRNLEMAKSAVKGAECCTNSDDRKAIDKNFTIRKKKSRDQGIQCENVLNSYRRNILCARGNKKQSSNTKSIYKRVTHGHPKQADAIVVAAAPKAGCCKTDTEQALSSNLPQEQSQQNRKMSKEKIHDLQKQLSKDQSEVADYNKLHNDANKHNNHCVNTKSRSVVGKGKSDNKELEQEQQKLPKLHCNRRRNRRQHHQEEHGSPRIRETKQLIYETKKTVKRISETHPKPNDHNNPTPDDSELLDDDIVILDNSDQFDVDLNGESDNFDDETRLDGERKIEIEPEIEAEHTTEVNVTKCDRNTNTQTQLRRKSAQLSEKLDSFVDCKLIVIGGIDPYCLHCQYEYQLQQQQQQQHHQQFHLSQYPHRKIAFAVDNVTPFTYGTNGIAMPLTMTTPMMAHNTPYAVPSPFNPSPITYNGTNNNNNNKLQQIGDQILLYDVSNGGNTAWRHLSHIPLGSRHHHAAVLCNGLIYVIGGTKTALGCTKKSIFEKSVWCFNPNTLKWIFECSLPESRRDFAVVAINEEIKCTKCKESRDRRMHDIGFFIIGGEGLNGEALNTVWFYSVLRKIWLRKASLNTGRYGLTAAMVNNEIWVAGGIINNYHNNHGLDIAAASGDALRQTITDTIEIYNLKCLHACIKNQRDDGELIYKMNHKAGNMGYVSSINRGAAGDGDLSTDQWIKSNLRLREPRLFGKLCKMPNDDLLMIGGIGINELGTPISLAAIDLFNFEQHEWRHIANLKCARHGHDVAIINDHCIVIVGGVSTTERRTLKTVEVFCTETHKSLNNLTELPLPVSGCAVIALK